MEKNLIRLNIIGSIPRDIFFFLLLLIDEYLLNKLYYYLVFKLKDSGFTTLNIDDVYINSYT